MKFLRLIKNAWLIVGLTIALLFAVEAAAYVAWKGRQAISLLGSPVDPRSPEAGYEDRTWAVQYFRELSSLHVAWRSYVYWRRVPYHGRFINIDKDGRRLTWKANTESDHNGLRFRIFMMGGSSLWGTGASDDETIPSIVARLLSREHGLNVEVTNFGETGYVSTQGVIALLRELQRENRPDLVIFYDGVNDTFSAYQNQGVAGLPLNESNREREFNLLRKEQLGRFYREGVLLTFRNSSTYYVLRSVVRRVTGRDLLGVEDDRFVSGPPDQAARHVARVYAWNVRLVSDLGQFHGFRSLFYWQPNIFTKDKLASHEQHLRDSESEPYYSYYSEARSAVIARLADVRTFHDLSGVFGSDPTSYFFDVVHLTGAGNAIVARRMVRDIVPIVAGWAPAARVRDATTR